MKRVLLLTMALLTLTACSDPAAEERATRLDQARAALESGGWDAALFHARAAWDPAAPEPEAALIAATACVRLRRAGEAIARAEEGLAVEGLDPAWRPDLSWARGMGYALRFREVSSDADWRVANVALEQATEGGSHRIEAAAYLASLQAMGSRSNPGRLRRFARLVISEAPDSREAELMRKLLEQQGL